MFFRIVFVHTGRVIGTDWAECTVADVPKEERGRGVTGFIKCFLRCEFFVWHL